MIYEIDQGAEHDKVGDRIPSTTVYSRVRDESVGGTNPFRWDLKHSGDYFANRRVVFFSLPGAFTPTCSTYQLPTFEEKFEEFALCGIDGIICASVNDAFVMKCWGDQQNVKNVELFPDGNGDFTGRMNMLIDKQHLGFGSRSWRYAMVVNNGVIEAFWEEPGINYDGSDDDPYGETSPQNILDYLYNNVTYLTEVKNETE